MPRNRLGSLVWLPGSCALDRANILFDAAECQSAPAEWLLAMVNHMLAERPNARNVSEDYAAGIVDSMLYDEELHGDYEPGFSAPVLVAVVRELRRTGGDLVRRRRYLLMFPSNTGKSFSSACKMRCGCTILGTMLRA